MEPGFHTGLEAAAETAPNKLSHGYYAVMKVIVTMPICKCKPSVANKT